MASAPAIPADTLRRRGYDQREVLAFGADRQGLLIDLPALSHAQLVKRLPGRRCLAFRVAIQGEQHPLVLIEGWQPAAR